MSIIKSFICAWRGFRSAFQLERSLRWQTLIAIGVIAAGALLKIDALSLVLVLIMIALVMALELVNSAFEKALDVLHPEEHKKIALVKDIMAGAVLFTAIIALIVGLVVFLPRLNKLVNL